MYRRLWRRYRGSSDGSGNGSSGSDPFSSVDVGSQTRTATIRRDATVDAVQAVDASGKKHLEVEVRRGTAEIPVATVGDCGACEAFTVHLPNGEYDLVAIQVPEDDAKRPTEVGRRAVSVDRSARISGVEVADSDLAMTVENTGSFLIRMQALRYEATDPATDAVAKYYSNKQKRKLIGIERTDSPDHSLHKTENRPLLEHIVMPGSNGTFEMGAPWLYKSEGLTKENACTGQSVDLAGFRRGRRAAVPRPLTTPPTNAQSGATRTSLRSRAPATTGKPTPEPVAVTPDGSGSRPIL